MNVMQHRLPDCKPYAGEMLQLWKMHLQLTEPTCKPSYKKQRFSCSANAVLDTPPAVSSPSHAGQARYVTHLSSVPDKSQGIASTVCQLSLSLSITPPHVHPTEVELLSEMLYMTPLSKQQKWCYPYSPKSALPSAYKAKLWTGKSIICLNSC